MSFHIIQRLLEHLRGHDDVDELLQVAVRVVVVRLPRRAAQLRDRQVHPEGQRRIYEA